MVDKRVPAGLRRKVFARARGLCEYCLSPERYSPQPFSIEHILPRVKAGLSALDNLALACQGCNNHKFTKTASFDKVSGLVVPLFNPRLHRWRDHFEWNQGATLVVGTTAIGRAAIDALHLNRESLVNLRHALFALEKHPPE